MAEHPNGDLVRVRELHDELRALEARLDERFSGALGATEQRLCDKLDRAEHRLAGALAGHERDHATAASRAQFAITAVIAVLAFASSIAQALVSILVR